MSKILKSNVQPQKQYNRKFHPQNFVHSSLFSEVYLFNDVPSQFRPIWERLDDNGKFDRFFENLLTLMGSFSAEEANKWNHSDTLKNLVFPMLEILGYSDICSSHNSILDNLNLNLTNGEGSNINIRPSVLVCEDEAGKKYIKDSNKNNLSSELKKYLKVPIQTSYYGALFDRKSNRYDLKKEEIGRRGDVFTNLGPNDQMAEYLKLLNVDWGIYTDGALWRLYRKEESAQYSEKFYEFDFSELFNLYRTSGDTATEEHGEFFEISKYLFWFFSYDGLFKGPTVIPFTEQVFQKGKIYTDSIEDDLKERFVHAMTIACNGYLETVREKGGKEDLRLISKTSESFIFNLIFIRSCESKRVLPIHQDYIHVSLKALIDKLRFYSFHDSDSSTLNIVRKSLSDIFGKSIHDNGYDIYDYIQRLHQIVENGDNGFGIPGFSQSVFYPDEMSFFKKYKINNQAMIKLVYQLFYNFNDSKNVQIPYNLITPRQLGAVYESFLEFQPVEALKRMVYVRKGVKGKVYWQWIEENKIKSDQIKFLPVVEKKGVIFSPNNEERKTTGSYYTPDTIVGNLVQETLGKLCRNKKASEILKIRVCDPAMGSGHFLLGAVDFLAKKIAEKEGGKDLTEIKRAVLESSIFGSDINPSAVKLAKMSLWLTTATPGRALERLDGQLVNANTLSESLEKLWKGNKKFNAIIGNPPYISMKKFPKTDEMNEHKEFCLKKYSTFTDKSDYYCCFVEKSLTELLEIEGRMGFVLSQSFLCEQSFQKMRDLLFSKSIQSVISYPSDAFEGIGVKTTSIIVENSELKKNSVHFYKYENEAIVPESECEVEQSLLANRGLLLNSPSSSTQGILTKIGFFDGDTTIGDAITHKINGEEKIGFLNGICTGDNSYWLVEGLDSKSKAEAEFKKKGHKTLNVHKYFKGSSLNQLDTTWGGVWINYCPNEMTEHSKKQNASKGGKTKAARSSAWPRTYYSNNKDPFYNFKKAICNSFISSDKIVCDIDTNKKFWDNNVNMFFINESVVDPYYVLGFLNSTIIGVYYIKFVRSNLSLTQELILNIPLLIPSLKDQEKIKDIVLSIKENGAADGLKKLDSYFYKIFQLSPEEIADVESLRNAIN